MLIPLLFLFVGVLQPCPPAQPDVAEVVRTLLEQRDDADPALIEQLAQAGTREAADGLLAAYDSMSSLLMQREVVRALPAFDTVEDAAQVVLQKLSDVATQAPEAELHEAAVDALGQCARNGPDFLRRIIDSPAEDVVRLRAMRRLVAIDADGDPDWYVAQFERSMRSVEKEKPGKARSGEKVERVEALTELRELALERIASTLSASELTEIARTKERDDKAERTDGLRRIALLEFERRGGRKAEKLAEQVFGDTGETVENRILAAQVLQRLRADKVVDEFVEAGLKDPSITPSELAAVLGELVASLRGPRETKRLLKEFVKEQDSGQRFILIALRGEADERFAEQVAPLLQSESKHLAAEAARWLGASGLAAGRDPLEAVLGSTQEPRVASAALSALGQLRAEDPVWPEELRGLAGDRRRYVRNAALEELAHQDARANQDLLIAALSSEDWTTRKVALEALQAARSAAGTGAIIARMGAEEGLMLQRFADALFELTGKPFRTSSRAWEAWWKDEGDGFEPIALEALTELRQAEERRRLAQTTRANSFFGIRVLSHRVVFVLDVSGSMEERLRSKVVGQDGETRIEFAKREMINAIERLEKGTFFNLITFSAGVDSWTPSGMALSSPENLAAAVAYTEKVRAGGGTNLFDALRKAFADREVDTIFVLSDGEPSLGPVVEPVLIRREVAAWNESRGVVIHAISVGGKFRILEWLTQDSGGSFTQIR